MAFITTNPSSILLFLPFFFLQLLQVFQPLFFLQLLQLTTQADDTVNCLDAERLALLDFRSDLIDYDRDNRLSTWGQQVDCCAWTGVRCNNRTNRVVSLDLRAPDVDNSSLYVPLRGNINPSLLGLVDLRYLDLSGNNFSTIEIPGHIGSIGKLRYLNLSNSQFVGSIPSNLGNLSMLRVLDLSGNWIKAGMDLGWMDSLRSLRFLDMSMASLRDVTTWLATVNELPTLETLHFRQCGIQELPSSLLPSHNGSRSLSELDLSLNNFNSTWIMIWFLRFSSSFEYIDFSGNQIQGEIPREFSHSIALSHLDLSENELEGIVPDGFKNLTSLTYLDLSRNNLTGGIPVALDSMDSLIYLDLSRNPRLGGRIPSSLGKFSSLSYLDLSLSNLEGGFPESSGNLTNLVSLFLFDNKLEGKLTGMIKFLWNSTMLTYLELSGNKFYGSVPPLSRFSLLKMVGLSKNKLNESFVERRMNLPSLVNFDLSSNMIRGSLPDMSSCSSLLSLELYENLLSGTLTQSIGYLSQLESLDIHQNSLEGVVSESHLFNLSKLQYLDMSFNPNLSLIIDSNWDQPFQLSSVKLVSCNLGSKFPKWLQHQRQVAFFDISNSGISDIVPSWFWENTKTVNSLNMSYNKLSGEIPNLSLHYNLSMLIDLSSNDFNGSLPYLPPDVGTIDLSRNKFSGSIDHFCNASLSSWVLDLSYNQLSGEVSKECFKNLMSVQHLNLVSNNFSGKIPSSINARCTLTSLHLRNNHFEGEIGEGLRSCDRLKILDLGLNFISGKIPAWIGENMPKLGILSLKSNGLFGTIPATLCYLRDLQILDLSMNKFNGSIPKCLNNFTVLTTKLDLDEQSYQRFLFASRREVSFYDRAYLVWKGSNAAFDTILGLLKVIDLSSNNLFGDIPPEIISLEGLIALNLSRNNLVGPIPPAIDHLEFLNVLDLSENKLFGHIPISLSQLSHLGILNLSFNNLSGRIPWHAHLQTFDASAFAGNTNLCGPPLSKPCPDNDRNVNQWNDESEDKSRFITKELYIGLAVGFVIAFGGVLWASFVSKFKLLICLENWLYKKIKFS